jgi:hypothetical protein
MVQQKSINQKEDKKQNTMYTKINKNKQQNIARQKSKTNRQKV